MTEIRELAKGLHDLMEHLAVVPEFYADEANMLFEAEAALTSLSSQVEALKAERTNLIETKREQIARLTRDNEMNSMRASTAEAERDKAIAKWEAADGMGGAVVDAIRTVLRESGVPQAAFIDDHVANAIVERNIAVGKTKAAEARVAVLEEALRGSIEFLPCPYPAGPDDVPAKVCFSSGNCGCSYGTARQALGDPT